MAFSFTFVTLYFVIFDPRKYLYRPIRIILRNAISGDNLKMATQKWKDDLENALTEVLPQYKVKELKSEQKLILQNILEHNDCMVTLPTGYGKSLPYQILLPVARKMKELGSDTRTDGKIVVCGPLVSLFEDQVSKLQSVPMIKSAFKGKFFKYRLRLTFYK